MIVPSWLPGAERLRAFLGWEREDRHLADMRLVVLDIDVTGTSLRHDRVAGIAALPIEASSFRVSDLRYCPLPDALGDARSADATGHGEYRALCELVTGRPVVTYNPHFVRRMIARAGRRLSLPRLDAEWIDLASAAGLVASDGSEMTSIDFWLANMRAEGPRPHDATYDVFAMAQMLQAVIAYGEDAGIHTVEALARGLDARPWLRRG